MFPSLRAWGYAIKLFFPAYVCGIVVWTFTCWMFLIVSTLLTIASVEKAVVLLLISLGLLPVGVIFYIVLKAIYRLILKVFWSNPPVFLAPGRTFRSAITAYTILTIGALPLALLYTLLLSLEVGVEMSLQYEIIKHPDHLARFLIHNAWLWVITVAYVRHWLSPKLKQIEKS